MAELIRDRARFSDSARRLALGLTGAGLFTLLTAIGAQISIPMAPLGVPLTLQTLAVVLAALCLGPRYGTLSMALYVLVGALGAPVFSDHGAGMAILAGQTGGYLLGFIYAQPVITWFVRAPGGAVRGWLGLSLGVIVGHLVIFAVGVPWLYIVRRVTDLPELSVWGAIDGGMVIFLPGMLLKAAAAVVVGLQVAPWAARRVW
jgi:biotin transport system substrate-specific component